MKIQVSENFYITADRYNWIAVEIYKGKDKNGNPKKQERETYHPSLERCLNHIRDTDMKSSETLEQLHKALSYSYTLDKLSVDKFAKEQAA